MFIVASWAEPSTCHAENPAGKYERLELGGPFRDPMFPTLERSGMSQISMGVRTVPFQGSQPTCDDPRCFTTSGRETQVPARRETEKMAKMNRDQERGGHDDFADVGEEPTLPARYAGTCATCGQRFAVGDPIASIVVNKKPTYHHGACRYPATALLSQRVTEAVGEPGGSACIAPKWAKCRATTNKGKPCNNAPQKGKQFCGPHLTQLQPGKTPSNE